VKRRIGQFEHEEKEDSRRKKYVYLVFSWLKKLRGFSSLVVKMICEICVTCAIGICGFESQFDFPANMHYNPTFMEF
jgi:hypothetical protein